MPSTVTASIGPMEHIAIRPKLFSSTLRPPSVIAMPTPSAIMKGTVIGPVVTPPESKARARKSELPFMTTSDVSANRSI